MERSRGGLAWFGLFILSIGLIWILVSVGVITWSIVNALIVLWPLILVVIGVNIIFRRNGLIKGLVWLVFLAVLISYSYFYEGGGTGAGRTDTRNLTAGTAVNVEKHAETQDATLRLAIGGVKLQVDSDTSNLLDASLQDKDIKHSYSFTEGSRSASIVFEKDRYDFNTFKVGYNEPNVFHLNPDVIWNLDVDTGATDGSLDLSKLKVSEINMNMGAANMKLTLGSYSTVLNIKAGMSNIDITIPADTGIKVKLDGGLNSTNMDGPGWSHEGGYYKSPGYDDKQFKIEADVDMGVGKLTVN